MLILTYLIFGFWRLLSWLAVFSSQSQAPGSVVVESWPASVLPLLRKRSGLFHWRVADYIENSDGAEAAGSEDIGSSSKFDSTSTSTNHQARRNHGSSIGGSSGNGGGDVEGGVDVSLRWHNSFNEAQEHGMAHAVPSLWPPSDREARAWQLNHCSRFLPHDQVGEWMETARIGSIENVNVERS